MLEQQMSIIIRQATEVDIPDIAAIHVAGWQGAYGGIVDQGYIDRFTIDVRIEKWTEYFTSGETNTLIACAGKTPVGFLGFGALRTPPAGTSKIRPLYSSEIYALYLMPEYFRQGVGTALMQDAAKALRQQKHQSTCLWVLDKNKRACSFYEKMGGKRIGKKIVEFGPTKAKEICYGWRDIGEVLKK